MSRPLRVGSLFAGIGGFDLAATSLGLEVAWWCEVDPDARRVLMRRFPGVPAYGDIAAIDPDTLPPVDVLVAGSPCQGFSVAGHQRGLKDERSGLFSHFIDIIDALAPKGLRYAVWENVPGVLTSNKGEDFANVIAAFLGHPEPVHLPAGPGGRRSRTSGLAYGHGRQLAWRVVDAQHLGLAQRRKRVLAVLDLAGRRAGEVLLECQGVPGDLEAGRQAGEEAAGDAGSGAEERGSQGRDPGAEAGARGGLTSYTVRTDKTGATGLNVSRELAPTLDHGTAPAVGPLVEPVASTLQGGGRRGYRIGAEDAAGGHLIPVPATTPTVAIPIDAVALGFHATQDPIHIDERALPLESRNGEYGSGVVFRKARRAASVEDFETWVPSDESNTLNTFDDHGDTRATHAIVTPEPAIRPGFTVRRLTPLECERLQGFPDDHTLLTYRDAKGKTTATKDSARYRQLGNAIAVPMAAWVLARLAAADAGTPWHLLPDVPAVLAHLPWVGPHHRTNGAH